MYALPLPQAMFIFAVHTSDFLFLGPAAIVFFSFLPYHDNALKVALWVTADTRGCDFLL